MERRISEAQGRRREAGSEGSVEQNRDPMDKNRITRLVRPDERAGNREVHTIKELSSRFGGCAAKAVELTSGDLRRVSQSGLAGSREPVIAWQKSAEGIVAGSTRRRTERWKGDGRAGCSWGPSGRTTSWSWPLAKRCGVKPQAVWPEGPKTRWRGPRWRARRLRLGVAGS